MCGSARVAWRTDQRALIDGLSVSKRTSMPAECRLRLQTGAGTDFSALDGERSNVRRVSVQPLPSTPQVLTSCQAGPSWAARTRRGRSTEAAPAAVAAQKDTRARAGR